MTEIENIQPFFYAKMEPEWLKLDFLKLIRSSSLLPMHVTFNENSSSFHSEKIFEVDG